MHSVILCWDSDGTFLRSKFSGNPEEPVRFAVRRIWCWAWRVANCGDRTWTLNIEHCFPLPYLSLFNAEIHPVSLQSPPAVIVGFDIWLWHVPATQQVLLTSLVLLSRPAGLSHQNLTLHCSPMLSAPVVTGSCDGSWRPVVSSSAS